MKTSDEDFSTSTIMSLIKGPDFGSALETAVTILLKDEEGQDEVDIGLDPAKFCLARGTSNSELVFNLAEIFGSDRISRDPSISPQIVFQCSKVDRSFE